MLLVLLVPAVPADAQEVDFWSLQKGSPAVSKITVYRQYELETRASHPQQRILSAWWDADGACLAWAGAWIYEPQDYNSRKFGPMTTETDTVQADYSAAPVTRPSFDVKMLRWFDNVHYRRQEGSIPDEYGNWTVAFREWFQKGKMDEFVVREIEYAGHESEKTLQELAYFRNIRQSGNQDPAMTLSKSQRNPVDLDAGMRKLGVMSLIMVLPFTLIALALVWPRYRRWRRRYGSLSDDNYNDYGAWVYLLSAWVFYSLPGCLGSIGLLNVAMAPLAVLLQAALTVWIYWKGLPALNAMLIYDRRQGYWGTTLLFGLNVFAAGVAAAGVLAFLMPMFISAILVIIGSCWYAAMLFYDQAYKCPTCRNVDGNTMDGITFGGIKGVRSQSDDHDVRREGDDLVETDTRNDRTDYYQVDVHNFSCRRCGATWVRRFRGKHLGYDKKTRTEETRTRVN